MLEKIKQSSSKSTGDVLRDQYIYQLETDIKVASLSLYTYLNRLLVTKRTSARSFGTKI